MQKTVQGLAVITGAASGMGEASARLMAEAGWTLLISDLNAVELGGRRISLSPANS